MDARAWVRADPTTFQRYIPIITTTINIIKRMIQGQIFELPFLVGEDADELFELILFLQDKNEMVSNRNYHALRVITIYARDINYISATKVFCLVKLD